ncbi:MAG: winged helix-turn-helix domain-containing protein [Telluria sp.]
MGGHIANGKNTNASVGVFICGAVSCQGGSLIAAIGVRWWKGRRCPTSPRYDMSFAAVQKHVAVLERAGLIQKRAKGREQLVSADHARLQRASGLLDHFESIWRQRLTQLDDVLLPKGK